MGKISMFGVSGSGKTCFLYAMSQVLQCGASQGNDFRLSIIANDIQQQMALNNGYAEMALNGKWPEGSNTTTPYDLRVRVQYDDKFSEIIPNLTLLDYAGGVWTNNSLHANEDRNNLMNEFAESSAVLFIVDGITLLQAMDQNDLHPSHRNVATIQEIVIARQQISFVENLFMCFKNKYSQVIPPVMIVVTKSDVFADVSELEKGKKLVKQYLPSIFAQGSEIEAGITTVSLGTGLGVGEDNRIVGQLSLNTQHNIHLPIVFGLYAYLSETYDNSPTDEQIEIEHLIIPLCQMMNGRVDMYKNGYPAIIM